MRIRIFIPSFFFYLTLTNFDEKWDGESGLE